MIEQSLFYDNLYAGSSEYGVPLDMSALSSCWKYYELLVSWNSRVNLVSQRDLDRFIDYHMLDSLKIASLFDFSRVRTMIDFGSGAGLPGIPLALAFPHISLTLIDSRTKRCAFLSETVFSIPLGNTVIVHSKIESLPVRYNRAFDVVVTRATASLADFVSKTSRFIHGKGSLISIKGDHIDSELSALDQIVDKHLFNISVHSPKAVGSVRQGTVVIISGV
ncbi:16S rRNA (guanine(527)-N(7))-methyltransferase RsmG [bacterium]|nr:16S rRNA (guanine(527)-N(7))-methyltransferase RsmG [bacterium]